MPVPVRLPASQGLVPPGPHAIWLQQAEQMINRLGEARAYAQVVPVTGFTQLIPNGTGLLLLHPAGVLASGTVTLPAQASDGFEQQILTSQTVTALTVAPSSGQTIVGVTSFGLTAGTKVMYRFVAATSTWYKML